MLKDSNTDFIWHYECLKAHNETCSHQPQTPSATPNCHNEGNMNDPVIIPCCPNNTGTVDGKFFSSH